MDLNHWKSKLVGKVFLDDNAVKPDHVSDTECVRKRDLPEKHRVVREGYMYTADFDENRLQVHVDNNNTIHKVTAG
ncbi:5241_t:CDS:2 [Paraglomus occultum]|uniref:5241_t:CDS:1 n=1 Tax=Paraglomus occultum TaxID=144539 RepID=A0A9N8VC80_9GLOM|nr:5241_t:CDS:2 [Paraglomus occultum]